MEAGESRLCVKEVENEEAGRLKQGGVWGYGGGNHGEWEG